MSTLSISNKEVSISWVLSSHGDLSSNLALILAAYVILDKLLNLSKLSSFLCKMETVIEPTKYEYCDGK